MVLHAKQATHTWPPFSLKRCKLKITLEHALNVHLAVYDVEVLIAEILEDFVDVILFI